MEQPKLKLTFKESISGYWDGNRKEGGTFEPEGCLENHPGKNQTIRWGCFYLNYWFNCGSGRSWKEASSIAKRRLQHLCKIPATIEIIS